MKSLLVTAAFAAAIVPTAATAGAIPAAVIAVVDLDRVTRDCNACKSAAATLQSRQRLSRRQRRRSRPSKLKVRRRDAAQALQGKPADAALEARAKAWETKRNNAAQEVQRMGDQLQRDQQYISQQVASSFARFTARSCNAAAPTSL